MSVWIPQELRPLLVDLTTISQHPRNPNSGDVDSIVESIQTVGYATPIIVQQSTGYIVAGNHRYAAMLELGETHIPAVVVDWDDDRVLRHLIGDNRTAELAHREESQVLAILQELSDTDAGLAGTAMTPEDIARLVKAVEPHPGMFNHLTPNLVYGVMVTCADADAQQEVLGILADVPGVNTRAVTL